MYLTHRNKQEAFGEYVIADSWTWCERILSEGQAVSELGLIIVGVEQVEHHQIDGDAP